MDSKINVWICIWIMFIGLIGYFLGDHIITEWYKTTRILLGEKVAKCFFFPSINFHKKVIKVIGVMVFFAGMLIMLVGIVQ